MCYALRSGVWSGMRLNRDSFFTGVIQPMRRRFCGHVGALVSMMIGEYLLRKRVQRKVLMEEICRWQIHRRHALQEQAFGGAIYMMRRADRLEPFRSGQGHAEPKLTKVPYIR